MLFKVGVLFFGFRVECSTNVRAKTVKCSDEGYCIGSEGLFPLVLVVAIASLSSLGQMMMFVDTVIL